MKSQEFVGSLVMVRCGGAGVHVGVLREKEWRSGSARVVLLDDRRLWRWKGQHTLHEVSTKGIGDEYKRLSGVVEIIELFDVHEILPVSPAAAPSLTQSYWTD